MKGDEGNAASVLSNVRPQRSMFRHRVIVITRARTNTHTHTSAFFNKYTTKTLSTRRHTRYVTHYKARVKHITALFSKVREESPRRRENPRREGSDTRSVLR